MPRRAPSTSVAARTSGRCASRSVSGWARCSYAPRCWWLRRLADRLALQPALLELLAQHLLVELADARLRHLVDERDRVGQPPLGHARLEVLDQVVRADARPLP